VAIRNQKVREVEKEKGEMANSQKKIAPHLNQKLSD